MVGYVRWEEKRKKLTLRRCPLGDGEVCLLEGGGRLNRRVQRRVRQAAQVMADAGVRYAAAPPEWAALLLPLRLPAPVALRRAMLGQLVDCACSIRLSICNIIFTYHSSGFLRYTPRIRPKSFCAYGAFCVPSHFYLLTL